MASNITIGFLVFFSFLFSGFGMFAAYYAGLNVEAGIAGGAVFYLVCVYIFGRIYGFVPDYEDSLVSKSNIETINRMRSDLEKYGRRRSDKEGLNNGL